MRAGDLPRRQRPAPQLCADGPAQAVVPEVAIERPVDMAQAGPVLADDLRPQVQERAVDRVVAEGAELGSHAGKGSTQSFRQLGAFAT